jgi:hypothetical protein
VTDEYGAARLRVLPLPNRQFLLVMDRAGSVASDPDRMEEWLILRNLTLSRLGPECVGFFRFAGDCDIPDLGEFCDERGTGCRSRGVYPADRAADSGARP